MQANKLLQQEEPLVHVLQPQLGSLKTSILQKFIQSAVLVAAIRDGTVTSIDLVMRTTTCLMTSLWLVSWQSKGQSNAGDISAKQHANFFIAARSFFVWAVEYLLKWCPLNNELLIYATWLSFENHLGANFNSVEFFMHLYPQLFNGIDMDRLQEPFLNYQLLIDEEIPKNVKESSG